MSAPTKQIQEEIMKTIQATNESEAKSNQIKQDFSSCEHPELVRQATDAFASDNTLRNCAIGAGIGYAATAAASTAARAIPYVGPVASQGLSHLTGPAAVGGCIAGSLVANAQAQYKVRKIEEGCAKRNERVQERLSRVQSEYGLSGTFIESATAPLQFTPQLPPAPSLVAPAAPPSPSPQIRGHAHYMPSVGFHAQFNGRSISMGVFRRW